MDLRSNRFVLRRATTNAKDFEDVGNDNQPVSLVSRASRLPDGRHYAVGQIILRDDLDDFSTVEEEVLLGEDKGSPSTASPSLSDCVENGQSWEMGKFVKGTDNPRQDVWLKDGLNLFHGGREISDRE